MDPKCGQSAIVHIPESYADRKALRDHLTKLLDIPGADPTPIQSCVTSRLIDARAIAGERVEVRIRGGNTDLPATIKITRDGAHDLGTRLLFLANNPRHL